MTANGATSPSARVAAKDRVPRTTAIRVRESFGSMQDFGNRDPAFPGYGVKQINPPFVFEYRGIAELVDLPVGGAAYRWGKRRFCAFPVTFGPQHLNRWTFLPVAPIVAKVDAA